MRFVCLALLTLFTPSFATEVGLEHAPELSSRQEDFDARLRAARGDTEALWKLANWCEARGLMGERDRTLRSLLRTDPEDKKARELLGHVQFEGKWFTSEKKLAAFKKKELRDRKLREDREAKEKGWVRHNGGWIDPKDLAYIERGWVRLEDGTWVSKEDKERIEAGWQRQDLEWIAPEEVAKIREGLWKCGPRWLSLEEADTYHSELDKWWQIPGSRFVVLSTCERQQAKKALKLAEASYIDMQRLFSIQPPETPRVVVLRELDQYTAFSREGFNGVGKSIQGLDSLRGAFFADLWVEEEEGFLGCGVSYWNAKNPAEDRWGSLWVRYAAAHSYIEEIDPSAEARAALGSGEEGAREFFTGFWEQKLIPNWLRYGAASYAERYFTDPNPNDGNDVHWARRWSAGEVKAKGGLDPLDDLFELQLANDDVEKSLHLLNQVGLLVAFLLDGNEPALQKELDKFHKALQTNVTDPKKGKQAIEKAVRSIERALKKNQKALAKFAGF